mmetsp:Transcript_25656/g.65144  ORF Transcript_25656/g.65144 Transcript_25656/m.65144 type:complete len:218 (-) Transcript_25656:1911-2564(-)
MRPCSACWQRLGSRGTLLAAVLLQLPQQLTATSAATTAVLLRAATMTARVTFTVPVITAVTMLMVPATVLGVAAAATTVAVPAAALAAAAIAASAPVGLVVVVGQAQPPLEALKAHHLPVFTKTTASPAAGGCRGLVVAVMVAAAAGARAPALVPPLPPLEPALVALARDLRARQLRGAQHLERARELAPPQAAVHHDVQHAAAGAAAQHEEPLVGG